MNPRPRYISSPALLFLSFFSFFFIHASTPHFLRLTHPFLYSIFFLFFFSFFKIDVKLIFVYHPISEETLVATNASIGGFFEGVEIFAKAMTSTATTIAGEVSAEVSIPPSEAIPTEDGTSIEGGIIGESTPVSTEPATPLKGATSLVMTQVESASPVTSPLINSTSDHFVALSRVVKDGSSLVVTLSSIPTSTT